MPWICGPWTLIGMCHPSDSPLLDPRHITCIYRCGLPVKLLEIRNIFKGPIKCNFMYIHILANFHCSGQFYKQKGKSILDTKWKIKRSVLICRNILCLSLTHKGSVCEVCLQQHWACTKWKPLKPCPRNRFTDWLLMVTKHSVNKTTQKRAHPENRRKDEKFNELLSTNQPRCCISCDITDLLMNIANSHVDMEIELGVMFPS